MQLKEIFRPAPIASFNVGATNNLSIEGFWQYAWANTKIDPVGSYFSTTDLAGAGANKVLLGFGSAPDTIPVGFNIPGNPVGVAVHIGSQIMRVEPLREAWEKVVALVHRLRERGFSISRVDFGGGRRRKAGLIGRRRRHERDRRDDEGQNPGCER